MCVTVNACAYTSNLQFPWYHNPSKKMESHLHLNRNYNDCNLSAQAGNMAFSESSLVISKSCQRRSSFIPTDYPVYSCHLLTMVFLLAFALAPAWLQWTASYIKLYAYLWLLFGDKFLVELLGQRLRIFFENSLYMVIVSLYPFTTVRYYYFKKYFPFYVQEMIFI